MSDSGKPPPRPKPPLPKKPPVPPKKEEPRPKEDSVLDLLPDPEPDEIAAEPEKTPPPEPTQDPRPSLADPPTSHGGVPPSADPPTIPLAAALGPAVPAWRSKYDAWAKDKPAWMPPVIGGSGVVVALILVIAIGKAACGSSAASTATVASATTRAASATASSTTPALAPLVCALTGERRIIAPKALAASGVEVAVLGEEIAVGFAATPNDATLEILDPANASTVTRVLARSNDPIRRVLPLSRTTVMLDVDRKKDPLHARRTISSDPPIDVGGTDDGFGWAAHKTDKTVKLWALPQANVDVEQVRGDVLPDGKGVAIAFRQGNVVYAGAFGGAPPAPLGPLVHVDGLGAAGGAPVVAASGDRVMIAWSDRAQPTEPWHLRTATFKVGDASAQPHAFASPAGGLGEQTMSPDLTPVGNGRFLLLWTEGTTTHQVRGAVLGEEGAPSSAFAVSADGVDSGQGQSAVSGDGRGVVAYLSSTSPGFYEVSAAPLKCGQK